MTEQPLVTVYTVTRNRADLLPRCMNSILNQTYKNIEYIIVDGASTDNTEEVVKSFNDTRIKYIKLPENQKVAVCTRIAFENSSGKYITELDDDDEYHLDKIEKQVALFETLPEDYGMVYCWMSYYDNSTKKYIKTNKAELRGFVPTKVLDNFNLSGTPTFLIRRSVIEHLGYYRGPEEIGTESDWEFAARVCHHYKVDYVPESLINIYVNHSHTRMSNVAYYKEYYDARVKLHKYFLMEFADTFKAHTRLKAYHMLRMSAFSLKAHHYMDFINYGFQFVWYKLFGTK